ncbi:MAG: hypothetical protein EOM12_13680 [Verrucomicrobiae bacterium]|nr:hypothetical protein [Verrucomicrobiae bacterium]
MKKCLSVMAILAIATIAGYANFDWGSYYYFYDTDGSTFLTSDSSESVGCFVQLIWDVDGDGLDQAVNYGTGIAAGSDDQVYMSAWLGFGGSTVPGMFVNEMTPAIVTAGLGEDGYIFYGRVWSAPAATWDGLNSTIDASSRYWDGSEFTYVDGVPSIYNMSSAESANITVNTAPIPEPTVIALGVLGIALVRGLRKVKK